MKTVVIFTRLGDFKVINLPRNMRESEVLEIVRGVVQERERRIITDLDLVNYNYMTESKYNKFISDEEEKGYLKKEDIEKYQTIIDYKNL